MEIDLWQIFWTSVIIIILAKMYGVYKENQGFNRGEIWYHGVPLTRHDLIKGEHYTVLGITIADEGKTYETPRYVIALLRGKKKGSNSKETIAVDFAYKDVSDEKGLRAKPGQNMYINNEGGIEFPR